MAEHQPCLKTDSPLSRRIVRSFFDFLDFVEPAPGVDTESLQVARECLAEVFRLDSSSIADAIQPNMVDIFRSLEPKSDTCTVPNSVDAHCSSSAPFAAKTYITNASSSLGEDWMRQPNSFGPSKDELFGKYFAALEKAHFFKSTPDGKDDPVQLDKATRLFHGALAEMESLGSQELDQNTLADTLKSQGNKAMQSKQYFDALELYTSAIALCHNAVYHCNRAAAYTQIHKYTEAINDCLKSIEIDPNYSKAYSRLGLAYYAQGNYFDAIEKGFKKALQLDPNNESVKENIRVAEQRMKEQHQRAESNQSTNLGGHDNRENNHSAGGSRSHSTPPPFSSMPFNPAGLSANIANMIFNVSSNAHGGSHSQTRQGDDFNFSSSGSDEPGVRIGGNVSFGEQIPEELSGAFRSVMEMFSGGAAQGNQQDGANGRSASN